MPCIGKMERFQPPVSLPMAPRRREGFSRGRLSDFRPAQAAASVTAPWDPRPEIRGDGDRRRTEEKGGLNATVKTPQFQSVSLS